MGEGEWGEGGRDGRREGGGGESEGSREEQMEGVRERERQGSMYIHTTCSVHAGLQHPSLPIRESCTPQTL